MSLGLLDWPRQRARKDNWTMLCLKTHHTEFDSSSSDEDFKKKTSARRYFTEYFHTLVTKIPQSSNVKREQKWIQKEEIPALSFLSAVDRTFPHSSFYATSSKYEKRPFSSANQWERQDAVGVALAPKLENAYVFVLQSGITFTCAQRVFCLMCVSKGI